MPKTEIALDHDELKNPIMRHYLDLFVLGGLCALLGVFIYFVPYSLGQALVGAFCMFFAPGYSLLSALYPEQKSIGYVQRLVTSVGLSVVITGLLSLGTSYLIGASLSSVFGYLVIWIITMIIITVYRRQAIPPSERFVPLLDIHFSSWRKAGPPQKWVSWAQIAIIILLLLAGGRLLWVASRTGPQFTEFYLLGVKELAANYPESVSPGDPITVTVGVVNHEGTTATYDLFYRIDENDYVPLTSILLDNESRWESKVKAHTLDTHERQKVTFGLHKSGEEFPYRVLHLWVGAK